MSRIVLLCFFLISNVFGAPLVLHIDENQPPLAFALGEIRKALSEDQVDKEMRLTVSPEAVSEGYEVRSTASSYEVRSATVIEAMYGGLEFAESLRLGRDIWKESERHEKPFLKKRGLKFNIPLDARTPSYDDSGDAAQRNVAEMWNFEFWREYLDQMAIHRYNVLTLWNPHPFPSMVKMPDYPDVALDDVCVTTLKPNGKENEWGEPQLVAENVVNNLEVVKTLTIDEKISFWKRVMQHATDRGIDLYFITWNICPNSVAQPVKPGYRTYGINVSEESPGKHGVTHQIDNPATIRYLRDSVKAFLLTYPQVKGIGVTAGEHMPKDWKTHNREEWLWNTYGKGILDAKKETPERTVEFIHRVWYSDLDEIMKYWGQYPDPFSLSFKYAKARLYSSPNIPFAKKQIEAMRPLGLKSWWNLRNDDIYVYRWGDPDYVRSFLQNFELDVTEGYHMGSDGYVWGREFVSKAPKSPRELEISKHWFNFLLWGRLGYDPKLGRDFFVAKIAERFPKVNAERLYLSWQAASRIVPLVNRFYWQNWDHMWSVESCKGHVEGFHEVTKFAENKTMEGSGLLNVREYVRATISRKVLDGKTPLDVADQLDVHASASLSGVNGLSMAEGDAAATLIDISAMAWLGRYDAHKIRAAVSLALFQETGEASHQEEGITQMTKALEACRQYAAISKEHYHSQILARPGRFDWDEMLESVAQDVELIRNARARRN